MPMDRELRKENTTPENSFSAGNEPSPESRLDSRTTLEAVALKAKDHPMSALVMDVDDFSYGREYYGEEESRKVLDCIADVLHSFMKQDFYACFEGESRFLCILMTGDADTAAGLAERIRQELELQRELQLVAATVSGGIACTAGEGETFGSLVQKADKALFHSRRFGGNRISVYSDRFADEADQSGRLYHFSPEIKRFVEHSGYPMFYYQILDGQYEVLLISDGYCKMMGQPRSELMTYLGTHSMSRVYSDDAERLRKGMLSMADREEASMIYRHSINGEYHNILCLGKQQRMEDGSVIVMAHLLDLTDTDAIANEMYGEYMAGKNEEYLRDSITGLPSISYFNTFADARIGEIQEHRGIPAVIFMDVFGMHAYNERFGYEEGNHLLRTVGEILQESFPGDLVVRYSEDHFVVITKRDSVNAIDDVRRINLQIPRRLNKGSVRVKAGVYYCTSSGDTAISAMDKARQAQNAIGDDRTVDLKVYDESVQKYYSQRDYVLSHFREALDKGWIQTYYQPLVRTLTGRLCGSEALSRWIDPVQGLLPPAVFIKPLEDAHLIHLLDLEIIRQVCRTLRGFLDQHVLTQSISVNLSRVDFTACDIFEEIEKIRAEYDIPASYLHIEVTESILASEPAILKSALKKFRDAGYSIWMDDFGSDYSTLNVLQNYQFDWLKIDMSFLRQFDTNPASRTIIVSVVEMAKRLGIHTLCEGVETKEEFEFLRKIGCEIAQGYYFSKPVPLNEMVRYAQQLGPKGYEPITEHTYYDSFGLINFMSDPTSEHPDLGGRPLALLEKDERDQISYVFISDSYKEQIRRASLSFSMMTKEVNNESSTFREWVCDSMQQARTSSNRISQRQNRLAGHQFDVRMRYLGGDGRREMYAETPALLDR